MTGYATLARYALWAALIIACTRFVWHMASTIHDNIFNDGRAAERAEWLEKDKDRIEEQAKALGEAMDRVAKQNERNITKTMEVVDERDKALAKLKNDMRTMRTNTRGMWISAKACDDSGHSSLSGRNDDSRESGGADQIRLPGDVERRLQEIGELAGETVIKYNACANKLRSVAKVVPNK
ncbi:hypothetical protein C8R26_1702 [Nitrosomonas oligotropha]|uniref:Bacteriophage Rz lysis protein n=2 Tax=Nitrosomonas oligotropha TaxID=42354 RepID=A0A2T5GXP2_9PROT|nr:hypothetical protein C8R26_1702 [Nitrosomonas oligotropha]